MYVGASTPGEVVKTLFGRMRWWGSFSLEDPENDGATARWQIGPLELWVSRNPTGATGFEGHEWRLGVDYDPDPMLDRSEIMEPAPPYVPLATARVLRYATPVGDGRIHLGARLPDRDVVVRADPPLRLVAGHEVDVYIGTPIWVSVVVGGEELVQLPSMRMPETWFGQSPWEGELCYALRSRARLAASEIPRRPNRAITVLSVRNEGPDDLLLERLKIPIPNLALYRSTDGQMWCQHLAVVRPFGGTEARVQVGDGPPDIAGEVTLEAPARRIGSANMLINALGALLS
jgi:hypothetical protein